MFPRQRGIARPAQREVTTPSSGVRLRYCRSVPSMTIRGISQSLDLAVALEIERPVGMAGSAAEAFPVGKGERRVVFESELFPHAPGLGRSKTQEVLSPAVARLPEAAVHPGLLRGEQSPVLESPVARMDSQLEPLLPKPGDAFPYCGGFRPIAAVLRGPRCGHEIEGALEIRTAARCRRDVRCHESGRFASDRKTGRSRYGWWRGPCAGRPRLTMSPTATREAFARDPKAQMTSTSWVSLTSNARRSGRPARPHALEPAPEDEGVFVHDRAVQEPVAEGHAGGRREAAVLVAVGGDRLFPSRKEKDRRRENVGMEDEAIGLEARKLCARTGISPEQHGKSTAGEHAAGRHGGSTQSRVPGIIRRRVSPASDRHGTTMTQGALPGTFSGLA